MHGFMSYFVIAQQETEEMCAEFTKRKEEASKRYWDATKLPRKKKKAVRKEAAADYQLYSILEKPVLF